MFSFYFLWQTISKSNVLIDKGNGYSFIEQWLTPGFHFQILSSFKKPMDECCDILIERLAPMADRVNTFHTINNTNMYAFESSRNRHGYQGQRAAKRRIGFR